MKEIKIAVITGSIAGFRAYVKTIYRALPGDKSIITSSIMTIEYPLGVSNTYYPIQNMDDLTGDRFDKVEKTDEFPLLENGNELLKFAETRIKQHTK
jgi:hypothetical protein